MAKIQRSRGSLKAILESLGVTTNPYDDYDLAQSRGRPLQVDNVAAVMVTATLPPFAKPGQLVDVNVSALGTASSLRGGNLVMTELRGIDGQTYAVAQGSLTVTGVQEEQNGTSVQIGIPTSGRIPGGATVERQVDTSFDKSDYIVFNVNTNDFSTTAAITEAVNDTFGEGSVCAGWSFTCRDSARIHVGAGGFCGHDRGTRSRTRSISGEGGY